jgi:hypothetical protein
VAARTTASAVAEILLGQYDAEGRPDLDPFISTATALVDWLAGKDTDGELTATLLERIEAFLSAHFYAHADQLLQSRSTGGASGAYQGQTAMWLNSTQYGQTAMVLDVTGRLAGMVKAATDGGKPKASMEWLGKPPSEQILYTDRD